ncbi:MAG TPA: elongation factor G [Candidatus Omnitrophota bacterium]|nr:elongation factor G [Candidatus Omnitrophota bacterium]HPT07009.1 elongation factor G [Candidatus Omnitrophota bacterium]
MDVRAKRNLILLGHAQSGKTTLAESMLFACKTTSRKGSVTDGTTVSDYSFDEIERKSSVNASLMFCDYKGYRIQIIDAPGYADFLGDVIAGLRAVDGAILIVDASAGVEAGTSRAWELLEEQNLPCIIFVNKADKDGVDIKKVLAAIKEQLSKNALLVDRMDSPDLIEAVAESDDALLEKYLDASLSPQEIVEGLHKAVDTRKVFPVFAGSALSDKGVADVLDAVIKYLPSPLERPQVLAHDPLHPEVAKEVRFSQDGSLSAFVFKNISDPYVGQLTLMRVFSGKLTSNTAFVNVNKHIKERIGQILILQGKEQRPVDVATCGDIIAIPKLRETLASDSICAERESVLLDPLIFPEPAISASVKPKSREDEEKISIALHKLSLEDPTFRVSHDPQTKEMIIAGMGDQHLEVMVKRLKKRFNVDVELGKPKISYKETITRKTRVQGKFKRQSGGRGQYGDCWIEIEPIERGKGFEFVDKIFGGAIPRNFIPSVEKGVRQACCEGAVAGYPIVDVRVTLVDGSYHDVDSSDMAFQIAGAMALRKAVQEAGPQLLEPVMEATITIPDDSLGAITGDINSRRGRMIGMDVRAHTHIIKANVPLTEMFAYANDLRSLTGGRGVYIMRFSHYEVMPQKQAQSIMGAYQAAKKHDIEI